MQKETELERKILQCIDEGLQTLGDSGKRALHYYLERNFGLEKEEVAEKPEMFMKGLSLIFGEDGASIIENWIVQKLTASFGLKQDSRLTLTEAISLARTDKHNFISPSRSSPNEEIHCSHSNQRE